jgi:predicted NBD/HSP70 family sugar kinase
VKDIVEYTGNFKQILELVYSRRQITRKTIAEITGFSNLTIAKMVTSLIEDGIIIETNPANTSKGRKPLLLSINPEFGYVIGIDIGAYSTKIGIVNFAGGLIDKEIRTISDFEFPSSNMDFKELQKHIAKLIEIHGKEKLLGIGVGITGLVDYKTQTIVFCPNIRGYNNLEISKALEEQFGVPAMVDTSARCMALGEKYFGESGFSGDLSFVSVGHSMAVGIIIGQKIFRGSNGFAGELGHVKAGMRAEMHDNKVCTCGSLNCIEVFITLPEMKKMIAARLEKFQGYSLLKEKYERTKEISYEDIANSASAGDKVAMEGLGETITMLGTVLADYINLFNPTLLVLGGGFFDLFPFVLPDVEQELRKQCLTPSLRNIQLHLSKLSTDGAIIGSAMQLIQRYCI